jgi:hypothetical protein
MGESRRNPLIAGTLVLFVARLALSLIRSGPVLVADEIGYLTNARVLAGGISGQLEMAPFYRGGYSALLAPLVSIGSPTTSYHLMLALNALLAASVFPLLYLLLSRWAGTPRNVAIWVAFAGSLYPALTTLSQVTMSENALFPLVVVWLIAVAGLFAAPPEGSRQFFWAAGLGAATGALWAVHNRMIVAVALAVAILAWQAARRRLRPAALVLGLVVIAVAVFGVHLLDNYLIDHNYAGSAPDELSERTDSLLTFAGLRTVVANLFGQAWYLLVATFGLAAAATWDFVRGRRLHRSGLGEKPPPALAALLALSALLLLVSAAAFPERTRPDMLIYGRYTEVVAPALIAFGLGALARARPAWRAPARPLLWFGALTALVVLIRATASDPDAANRWNISALPFVTVQLGPAILIGAALVATAGAGLLLWASTRGTKVLGLAALALFVPVIAYGAWNPVRSSERAVYPAGWESPESAARAAGAKTIAYDLDDYDTIGLYTVQWFLPDTKLKLFHGSREPAPSRFVLSGEEWGRDHPGARPLWNAVGRDETLWQMPSANP